MGANLETDLFGDPIVERLEGPGRPEHVPTRETRNKVLLCFVLKRSVKEAAQAIGVSVPTLRKHYFAELEKRTIAALRFEMTQLHRLNERAEAGNISAERELLKLIDKARIKETAARVTSRRAEPKAPAMGKKEAARHAAQNMGGLYSRRRPPPGMVN